MSLSNKYSRFNLQLFLHYYTLKVKAIIKHNNSTEVINVWAARRCGFLAKEWSNHIKRENAWDKLKRWCFHLCFSLWWDLAACGGDKTKFNKTNTPWLKLWRTDLNKCSTKGSHSRKSVWLNFDHKDCYFFIISPFFISLHHTLLKQSRKGSNLSNVEELNLLNCRASCFLLICAFCF